MLPQAQSQSAPPAGGAAIEEVVIATAAAVALTLGLAALGWAHRTGRVQWLGRVADRAGELGGIPRWAALPGYLAVVSLLVAVFGMYWDIALHIGEGRDEGPLANPAHYFILAGLFGIFVAGFLAVVLPEGRPSRAAVRISGDWYAPVSGIVLLLCSSFALLGFPLDDVWHRIFGQDVTLWGPTHLMMIGGAGLSLLGNAGLFVEGGRPSQVALEGRPLLSIIQRTRFAGVCGGLLVGLCTFQAEFDFGVPQFRLLFQPVLIATAGAIALTAARIYYGRGGALVALVYYYVVRGLLALLVGPVLGEPMPHFPLFAVEALAVEAAALAVAPRGRPYAFGLLSGVLIGTAGFAGEYAWSHVWMPMPWPPELVSDALVPVPLAALAGGLIGGFVGSCFAAGRFPGRIAVPSTAAAAAAAAVIAGIVAYGLRTDHAQGVRGAVTLETVRPGAEREVAATVRLRPRDATAGANWISAIAWQGGGLVLDRLEQVREGVFRTTEPLPVHGTWKTAIRLHSGSSLVLLPIYLPADPAIPAPLVPARQSLERAFVPEKEVLQRELKDDVPAGLATIGYTVVGSIALVLVALLGWALARLGRSFGGGGGAAALRREGPGLPAKGTA